MKETPLSFSDHPVMSLSGSDHRRSQSKPVSGTSVGRMTRRICSILCKSGDRPPCMVKIFSSIMAAIGRQLKQSVKVFHSLILYRRLPTCGVSTCTHERVYSLTLVVEAIDAVDTRALVITSENEEVFWVFDLDFRIR